MGDFLYFPENKLEYIPSVIQLLIFMMVAVLVFRFIIRLSRRELQKAKALEEQLKNQQFINTTSNENENDTNNK